MRIKNLKIFVFSNLAVLTITVLFIGLFICKGRPAYCEDKRIEANEPPEDTNDNSKKEKPEQEKKKPPRPTHNHPAFEEFQGRRSEMVKYRIIYRYGGVSEPNTIKAMTTVPRHAFVLPIDLHRAYGDHPLSIDYGQTISQPYIVAYMTQALNLEPNSKVLEIGTGSGYQAAVCAEIAEEVYTIEIITNLAKSAENRLKELGYQNVFVKAADGYFGWEEEAPFDAIIVTCAAGFVPPPLIKQLKPNGLLILPLGSPFEAQTLVLITKDKEGKVTSKSLLPVTFVPMTGRIRR